MALQLSKKNPSLAFILIFFLVTTTSCFPLQSNTPLHEVVVCVYRISGTYGSISRWLYYASILFGTLFRTNESLAASIMATAMLSSSAAIAHALFMLCKNGLNPQIIDLDIIPITTITVSTTFFFGAIRDYCTTLRTSYARDVLYIWSIGLCVGCVICCASTWNLQKGALHGHSSEIACWGERRDENVTVNVMLDAPSRLEHRNFVFNCTYDCFSAHTLRIRDAHEIRVLEEADLYTTYITLLPFFALVAVIRDFIMLAIRWQLSRLLGTYNWRPHNIEPALLFVAIGTIAAQRVLEYSIPGRFIRQWTRLEGRWRETIDKHPHLLFLLQKIHSPALALAPRNLDNTTEHVVNALNAAIVLCPGLAVIILGEAVCLRRDALLKSEDYSGVGQWSVPLCFGFLVSVQLLDWKVLRQLRLQPQPSPDAAMSAA